MQPKDSPDSPDYVGPVFAPDGSQIKTTADLSTEEGPLRLRVQAVLGHPSEGKIDTSEVLTERGSPTRVGPNHSRVIDRTSDGSSIIYIKTDPTKAGKQVEQRRFAGEEFIEAVRLTDYSKPNDAIKVASIIKRVRAKDGTYIYIHLIYENWENHSSGFGRVKRGANKPLLPNRQASFGSHQKTNGVVKPEDLYLYIDEGGTRGHQIELREALIKAGIATSDRADWRSSEGDKIASAVEDHGDSLVIKFDDDDVLPKEVVFPKEIAFESLWEEWNERFTK